MRRENTGGDRARSRCLGFWFVGWLGLRRVLPVSVFGGGYGQYGSRGLFYVNCSSVSYSDRNIGCRVLLGLATHLHSSSSQAAERAPRPTGQGLLSPLLLLFLANPLMLGFARTGRGEGVIFLGTPWCRLANRTRFSTLPQPAGAVERL